MKHGLSYTPEYAAWAAMVARCYRPSHPKYPSYGGRGITVCERWRHSAENLIADIGPRPFPSASLGRIDNDGDYELSNVRWETPKQQMRNTRWNRMVTVNGVTKPLAAWSEETGINWKTLHKRITSGWPEGRLFIAAGSEVNKKLKAEDVVEIRRLKASKTRMKKIADQFGVTVSMISKVTTGDSWKHIPAA